jgi:DNA-binding NarL/FixJ family response regulator
MQTPIKMLLADSQQPYHQVIHRVLNQATNIEIMGEATNGEELIAMATNIQPDLVIISVELPVLSGIEATSILRHLYPSLKILGVASSNQQDMIIQMMQAGANGYIVKHAEMNHLTTAIDTVMTNQPYFCASTTLQLASMLARGIFNVFTIQKLPDNFFAAHEKEILQLICMQYSSKQIAQQLGLACKSVEKYRHRLMQKTDSQNMAGLVLFALKHGIASPPL